MVGHFLTQQCNKPLGKMKMFWTNPANTTLQYTASTWPLPKLEPIRHRPNIDFAWSVNEMPGNISQVPTAQICGMSQGIHTFGAASSLIC